MPSKQAKGGSMMPRKKATGLKAKQANASIQALKTIVHTKGAKVYAIKSTESKSTKRKEKTREQKEKALANDRIASAMKIRNGMDGKSGFVLNSTNVMWDYINQDTLVGHPFFYKIPVFCVLPYHKDP
jgi:hypothetical protein